jgi:hypothetical protein
MSVCQCDELPPRWAHNRRASCIVTPNLIPGHFAMTISAPPPARADDAHPTASSAALLASMTLF